MTELRNRHDRFDSHFGTWTADYAVLDTAIADIPAGTTLQEALELIVERLSVLESGQGGRFKLDASIRRMATGTFTLRAEKTLSRIGHLTLDASLIKHATGSLTLDAVARKIQSGSFTLDARYARTTTGAFLLDGWITGFILRAVIRRTQAGSFLLDATIRPLSTFTGMPGDDTAMFGNFVLGEPG